MPFRRELPRQLDSGLSESIKKLDDSLFKLFLVRLFSESLFDLITENDLLRPVRVFLKSLSESFDVALPISDRYLGSYEEFMLNEWRILYGTSPEYFVETEWKDSSGKVRKAFKIEVSKLKHVVPLHHFSPGTAGEYRIIDKEKFLELIGEKEKRFFKFFSFLREVN